MQDGGHVLFRQVGAPRLPVCSCCANKHPCTLLLPATGKHLSYIHALHGCRRTATASDILPIAFSFPALLHAAWVAGFLCVYRPGPHLPQVGCTLSGSAGRSGTPDGLVAGMFSLMCATLVLLTAVVVACSQGAQCTQAKLFGLRGRWGPSPCMNSRTRGHCLPAHSLLA